MAEPYSPSVQPPTYSYGRPQSGSLSQGPTVVERFGQRNQTQNQVNTPNRHRQQGQVDSQSAKIASINTQLEETKTIIHNNIESLTERGERLEHLDQRTHDLSIHAQTFKTQATTTRRKFWWKNKKVRLLFSPPLPPSSLAVYLLSDLTLTY
ncbi:hypothetical protein C349_05379 [Cryptococcus neoformans var. grubii Br795]|nr:hypothetical protein C353_05342 [Cryptococcus neoformans var. grubii AD1-83a]OXG51875.1 hypothetical protein C354_05284 [Cryptococcus neoformans var. grubii MW-RSA1955]OXG55825.1 hypothetical protein C352_05266 [Cryptococcus neoformans var. grubii CHC193]OXG59502.1 hypothetical protein C351_05271 [Cryptococcus neoformans var. grubii c8]OXG76901.1 hypothetical protein C349_05379 [Cryptococcus neoformans var. grubii Br795]OXH04897.1 hypothetical protein C369_05472 [Cryptococcus neoformans var